MRDRSILPTPSITAMRALAVLLALVTFGDVFGQELHGTAAFYAALVREMIDQGDFLAPYRGVHAYLLKPPLAFWLSATSAAVFGVNDFAMTLPSRVGGLGCAYWSYLLASRLYGPLAGWCAALVFVANGIYIQFTTNFRMDSLMTLGALLTVWGYLNPAARGGSAALFGGLALAALTKGPMVFVMVLIFVPHALVTGHWRQFTSRNLVGTAWLLIPLAWYAYLWLEYGAQVSAQLNEDFWRGDTALGLSAMDSALLEYVVKPFNRLWPWLPFMVAGLALAGRDCLSARYPRALRADIGLIIGMFALNYVIAVIKPDPDVRYLYPSLPLLAILTGGMLARMLTRLPVRWLTRGTLAAIVLVTAYVVHTGYRDLADVRGLRAMRSLAAREELTAHNTAIVQEVVPAPDGPRRNDPLPDSVYYYFGITPANIRWPATAAGLPPGTRYVIVRRKRSYAAQLRDMGLVQVARSAKILLFERPGAGAGVD
jgi:4-amino-4-deoxy-L-arabinose transferase-like glycosyltransferase